MSWKVEIGRRRNRKNFGRQGEVERLGEKIFFFFFNCGRLVYLGLHPIQTVFYEERRNERVEIES